MHINTFPDSATTVITRTPVNPGYQVLEVRAGESGDIAVLVRDEHVPGLIVSLRKVADRLERAIAPVRAEDLLIEDRL